MDSRIFSATAFPRAYVRKNIPRERNEIEFPLIVQGKNVFFFYRVGEGGLY